MTRNLAVTRTHTRRRTPINRSVLSEGLLFQKILQAVEWLFSFSCHRRSGLFSERNERQFRNERISKTSMSCTVDIQNRSGESFYDETDILCLQKEQGNISLIFAWVCYICGTVTFFKFP